MLNRLSDFLAMSFSTIVVFFFLPIQFYGENAKELGNDLWLVHVFFAAGAILLGINVLPLAAGLRVPRWLTSVGFTIGAAILVADIFAPLQLEALDGTVTASPEPLTYTTIELVLAAGVCLVTFMHYRSGRSSAVFAVLALCLVGAVGFLYTSLLAQSSVQMKETAFVPATNGKPNIYHLHLDELQTDYLLKILDDKKFGERFSGFTLFKNNISNYPYTVASVPSYMTSTIYDGSDYAKWIGAYDTGLIKDLSGAAYFIEMIGLPNIFATPLASQLRTPEDIFKETYHLAHPQLVEFVSLWLAKALPNPLTNEALAWGSTLGRELSRRLDRDLESEIPQTVEDGVQPFQAMNVLEVLTETEQEKPATGRYQYIQAILPHGPYIFDPLCRIHNGPKRPIQKAYADQVACGLNLVGRFIDELKRLGRFDASMIIVHSDHGAGWPGFADEHEGESEGGSPRFDGPLYGRGTNVFGGSQRALESRAMAVLMIKPPESTGDMRFAETRSQLLDVYPTIMDSVGLPLPKNVAGRSLIPCIREYDCTSINARPQNFYVFPNTEAGKPLFVNRIIFRDGKPHFGKIEEFPPID